MSADIGEQYDKVYRYCYFKVHDKRLAEDLTQETFLRYFMQHSYIHRGKQLAYLYTIARNLCIDYYRRHQEEGLKEESDGRCGKLPSIADGGGKTSGKDSGAYFAAVRERSFHKRDL